MGFGLTPGGRGLRIRDSGTAPFARYVTVSVQKNFTPLFGTRFFPGANSDGTFTLRSTAGVRIQ